jgi:hypothetical protein
MGMHRAAATARRRRRRVGRLRRTGIAILLAGTKLAGREGYPYRPDALDAALVVVFLLPEEVFSSNLVPGRQRPTT